MDIALTDEQRALAGSIRDWAAAGGDAQELAAIGLLAVALPEDAGGAGGTVADLAAGVGEAAAALASGPLFGSLLAGLTLTRAGDSPVAKELLPALAEGTAQAAVALDAGSLVARRTADGGLVVTGRTGPVPDAAAAAHLLLAARLDGEPVWFALPPGAVPVEPVDPAGTLDPSRPLGHAEATGVTVPPEAVLGAAAVPELAATLAAAEAAGVAAWCVRTASGYAKVREQFGAPIGSFQAVKHLCAEMLCRAETAAALAWDAARAADEDPRQHVLAAAVAAAGALDAAVGNAKDCIQVLGGIGFTWEHDAHRYLRRALALRQLLGGTARWRRTVGELTMAGARRQLDVDLTGYGDAEHVAQARRVATELAALDPHRQRLRLAETGYLVPHWPPPHGLGASPARQLVIDAELRRAGVRRPDLVIGAWAVPTILEHGSAEQRERFVGPTLRGELTWCQLFSEPGAGSDLASLRTRAERAPGGWRLSGQKVWTSLAHEADWAICLARTDPDAPKHQGITYFLVDMRSEGIDIRPLREITGETRFNEVFLDGVFVPDADVVGEVDGGWRLARTTLANERVALGGGSSVGEAVEALVGAHPELDADLLGGLVVQGCALSVLALRDTLRRLEGQEPGAESSVRKLLGVRHRQEVAEVALDVLGPAGAVAEGEAAAAQHEFLLSRCLSIAGGTTQVLLNVVGERLLGLPR
ncbi:acyl-CoA dehydrogenase [Prauserella muralis]|uniref:Acyl-CoA dehydrogenase n=1 Tax=Prauserella muralis TaxID=588067 RepID=A0A2V4B211_9PSEU|nr:acyl-CoA dehydrogenase [Prauserella muralis]PXY28077.1 acyl-CoA dehydrogenase [Prauserella muralis]TWE22122.1 alkylation response protein AidB-like acyl-CoA dehydrogenase [Prauserella muralis]